MANNCIECDKNNRTNQKRLDPLLLPITYESSKIISSVDLPRKYTSTHNDLTSEIYLSIGHNYNSRLLSSEEVIKNETQVLGEWIRKNNKYEIRLKVLVSTEKNPLAEIRNAIFCQELGVVLEGIALAETALLHLHPALAATKIFVDFISIDPKYNRTEYWHRLGYWTQHPIKLENNISANKDSVVSERKDNVCHQNKCNSSTTHSQNNGYINLYYKFLQNQSQH